MGAQRHFSAKCARMSCTEQPLRIAHLQEVGHILRHKNKWMSTVHRTIEFLDTSLICKMGILGWRKQLSKISINLILMRILGMILHQQQNEDEDMDLDLDVVDKVAEEEELQVVTTIKQTGHQVTREHNPNLRLKLSHHVTRKCNPLYHPRLKPNLYQSSNPKPKLHHSLLSHWQLDNQVILLMYNYYMAR